MKKRDSSAPVIQIKSVAKESVVSNIIIFSASAKNSSRKALHVTRVSENEVLLSRDANVMKA